MENELRKVVKGDFGETVFAIIKNSELSLANSDKLAPSPVDPEKKNIQTKLDITPRWNTVPIVVDNMSKNEFQDNLKPQDNQAKPDYSTNWNMNSKINSQTEIKPNQTQNIHHRSEHNCYVNPNPNQNEHSMFEVPDHWYKLQIYPDTANKQQVNPSLPNTQTNREISFDWNHSSYIANNQYSSQIISMPEIPKDWLNQNINNFKY